MLEQCKQLKNDISNYKTDKRYLNYLDRMYDITTSCEPKEVLNGMLMFIDSASKNKDVYAMLAAYDIYCQVKEEYEN